MTEEQFSNNQNQSERYLSKLCQRAFLSLWSYPNLYTDEGKRTHTADGKELCDLCVVFGNDVILFSDKVAEFGQHEDLLVNWSRWYKRAIKKSANQLYGAKSWILNYPTRIFVDKKCTKPFPLPIPELTSIKFHLVAVTRGSYDACHAFHGANSIGSLKINTNVIGADHEKNPFTIGIVDRNKSFIHIFDEFSLEVVLRELDTISDFLHYLNAREDFLTSKTVVIAAGEEQLVAKYLTTFDDNGSHLIFAEKDIPQDADSIVLTEGFWEGLVSSSVYSERKKNFQDSYFWDSLIERFISFGDPKNLGIDFILDENPPIENAALRVMATEPRWVRMELVRQFRDVIVKAHPNKCSARIFSINEDSHIVYVFIVYPNPENLPYEEYRKGRTSCLLAYCMSVKLVMPNAIQAVGIAVDYPTPKGVSEDLSIVDFSDWTEEREVEAKALCEVYEILQPDSLVRHTEKGNRWGVSTIKQSVKSKRTTKKSSKNGKTFGKTKKRKNR